MWGNFHIFSYIYLDKTKPKVRFFGRPPLYTNYVILLQSLSRMCAGHKKNMVWGLRWVVGTMWLHTSRVETLQPMLWMMRHFSSSLPFQHSNILNCIEEVKGGLDFSQEVFWTLGVAHVSCFLSLTVIIHDMFLHCLVSCMMFKK